MAASIRSCSYLTSFLIFSLLVLNRHATVLMFGSFSIRRSTYSGTPVNNSGMCSRPSRILIWKHKRLPRKEGLTHRRSLRLRAKNFLCRSIAMFVLRAFGHSTTRVPRSVASSSIDFCTPPWQARRHRRLQVMYRTGQSSSVIWLEAANEAFFRDPVVRDDQLGHSYLRCCGDAVCCLLSDADRDVRSLCWCCSTRFRCAVGSLQRRFCLRSLRRDRTRRSGLRL